MKRPRIFHQPEKSYHCGACAAATVLTMFGEEPPAVPALYAEIKGEGTSPEIDGIYEFEIASYFLRKDWVAIQSRTGGPMERDLDPACSRPTTLRHHSKVHQRIATWRVIHQMLQDGYACILSYRTAADTTHFAVVYDAFVRRNIYTLRLACSSQGYLEYPAEQMLDNTGSEQLFIKPHVNEYR